MIPKSSDRFTAAELFGLDFEAGHLRRRFRCHFADRESTARPVPAALDTGEASGQGI